MIQTTESTALLDFRSVRSYTENLCQPLKVEDYIPQPVEYISPAKWHLGHTSWFFEEFILKHHAEGYREYHSDFSFLFNSYYNTIGTRIMRTDRGNMTRPSVEEVYAYRAYVDQYMEALLSNTELAQKLHGLLAIGLNHEQQHQELLITDLKYILGHNPLFPVYKPGGSRMSQHNEHSGWVNMAEGVYEIGHRDEGFCYDNELMPHKTYLHDYAISKALVTNGEYLEFINDGGYERFELWLDEGWSWVNSQKEAKPLHWHKVDDAWHYFTLEGLKPVDPNAILCHINLYEAAAFAEWKGMRLPTEFEWEAASEHFSWGTRWEWTNSAYLPYPGFKKPPGAVGEYNGKFMINQMVLRGASAATSPGHSRKTYRNFFHPHLQWQYSGIRLAHDR